MNILTCMLFCSLRQHYIRKGSVMYTAVLSQDMDVHHHMSCFCVFNDWRWCVIFRFWFVRIVDQHCMNFNNNNTMLEKEYLKFLYFKRNRNNWYIHHWQSISISRWSCLCIFITDQTIILIEWDINFNEL